MEESQKYCKNCKRDVSVANYATHSAFCERKIKLCDYCGEPVQRTQIEEHMNEWHVTVSCTQCEENFEKWKLPNHMEECPKRLVTCEFCEGEFSFDDLTEHIEFCGSRTEKCTLCKKFIMLKEKDKHMKVHLYEQKIPTGKHVAVEMKQNSVNEMISNSDVLVSENSPQVQSKHYGICFICKKKILWVDMNTHVPTCASASGKCSRCGESVSDCEIKDHVMKYCKLLPRKGQSADFDLPAKREMLRRDEGNHDLEAEHEYKAKVHTKCPYCKNPYDEDAVLDHISICEKNTYECPLCSEVLPEKDKGMHESFKCKVLLEAIKSDLPPSYADATRKTSYEGSMHTAETHVHYKSNKEKLKICEFCKKELHENERNDLHNCPVFLQEGTHEHYRSNKGKLKTCKFCGENLYGNEINHLQMCRALLSEDYEPRYNQNFQNKGAVPKKSSQFENVPAIKICRYCDTRYNADVLPFHEDECVNKCRTCPACEKSVSVKDAAQHIAEYHSGRGLRGRGKKKHETPVRTGKNDCITSRLRRFWSGAGDKDGDKFKEGQRTCIPENYITKYHDENALIPCEFCDDSFPPDEIVIHMTGCKPELVSYSQAKTDVFKEDGDKIPRHQMPTVASSNKSTGRNVALQSFCNSETSSTPREDFFQHTRTCKANDYKRTQELSTRPGEYLGSIPQNVHKGDKLMSSSEDLTVYKAFKDHLNQEAMEVDSESLNISSCWNNSDEHFLEENSLQEKSVKQSSHDINDDELHDLLGNMNILIEDKKSSAILGNEKMTTFNEDKQSPTISDKEISSFVDRSKNYTSVNITTVRNETTIGDDDDLNVAETKYLETSCKGRLASNVQHVKN